MGVRNQEMRRLKTEMANKDAIIAGFEADRVTYQGMNAENFHILYQAYFYTADILLNIDTINKAKEFTKNLGSFDRLRDENIELKKLNDSMTAELETAKKNLDQAEQALETEKQKHKDAVREVQDWLDKHLDESLAIDNQL